MEWAARTYALQVKLRIFRRDDFDESEWEALQIYTLAALKDESRRLKEARKN